MKINFNIFYKVMLIVVLVFSVHMPVYAKSIKDIESELKDLDKEQKELESEQESIDSDRKDTDGKIDKNLSKQSKVEEQLEEINEELEQTIKDIEEKENSILEANTKITELNDTIDELEEDIEDLEERIAKRDELLKERLQSIQQNGGLVSYIEVLLDSQSFGDFISRASAVNVIMDQDKVIMEEQAADKADLEDKKEEVESNKSELEDQKEKLEEQKDELQQLKDKLDEQMDEQEKLMEKLEIEYEELEEYKLSLEEQEELIASEKKAIEKAKKLAEDEKHKLEEKKRLEQLAKEREAEKRKATANDQKTTPTPTPPSGNGLFLRPVSGGVTSHMGWRKHPIHNIMRFHAGTDFGVNTGTPLLAGASGVVSFTGWKSGYGQTIIITHHLNGQTYVSLSAHLSEISVSPGDTVTKGEVIGKTGNTGDSTGPHLHYEIHKGGINWNNRPASALNPMHYF